MPLHSSTRSFFTSILLSNPVRKQNTAEEKVKTHFPLPNYLLNCIFVYMYIGHIQFKIYKFTITLLLGINETIWLCLWRFLHFVTILRQDSTQLISTYM